ncbi:glycoside hydrolase family 51 protein [Fistulina hepatica ATCC 64428]|uniref:non-reducing end alpha-L-arabinofuranosidase n=1 Tax=Fistulina hepatica ATCC 64428 TaxID=1128425 RepID=A0A0D7A225_9AGAR|nr:glycoside hydrolase family 51 protein [Fistulina hepatica ATCC 64428]
MSLLKFLPFVAIVSCAQAVTVSVSATASHAVPTTLFGLMFESGDGGLYAELLQNRAFQQVTAGTSAALTAWDTVNDASIVVIADSSPVSVALPNSLEVTIPAGSSDSGFSNSGYLGIKIDSSWTYNASFYYKSSSGSVKATVGLQTSAGESLASSTIALDDTDDAWVQTYTTLTPSASADAMDNYFTIVIDASDATSDVIIDFAMFSLFPPTYKGRTNGMRIDIAETLAEMKPAFFRFPGGNNLGESVSTRWKWNATLGPLVDRPGRVGDWGYVNTDGLGLLEYLYWCEDMGMDMIMAVYDGYSLDGVAIAEDDMEPYIASAIGQINFVVGDPTTSAAAAWRAALGREEPFNLTYVEIGNEDFTSTTASSTYVYRWEDIVSNLSATFPDLQFIATTYQSGPVLTPTPQHYDNHIYDTIDWFAENSFAYDSYERNSTTYFQGEYAVVADGRLEYPTMWGSSAEAVYMTGLERNSDIVFAASYAPLLNHVNASEWTPNLVGFDSGTVYPSTSYYVQKLFSLNKGDEYYPSTLPSEDGTIFWSVVKNTTSNELIIKVANPTDEEQTLTFDLPFSSVAETGTLQLLTGSQNASNTPAIPNAVVPTTSQLTVGSTFDYEAPGYSVSVISFVVN